MTNIFIENANYRQDRNPNLAPVLSLVPGLGQIYNGQARKGVLFLATALSYLFVFILILFNQAIREGLRSFGQSVHMQPDQALISALSCFQFGSSLSLIVFLLYACFVLYAMRDAFDLAALQQRKYIYADCALEINEAASGSYLLHFASIAVPFVLAVFFFKHSPRLCK